MMACAVPVDQLSYPPLCDAGHKDDQVAGKGAFSMSWGCGDGQPVPTQVPAYRILLCAQCLATKGHDGVVSLVHPLGGHLPWYTMTPARRPRAL